MLDAMFERMLIANRGEIAVRIARTCREMGVSCVAVHSDVDAKARHVAAAAEAVHLPGIVPAETYLNVEAMLEAARATGCGAIHPGYGFLAESADFADAVTAAGLVWVGPPPDAMRLVGNKISARRTAEAAGVPVVPGLLDAVENLAQVRDFAAEHGYPVAVKAAGGGGGRGLKVAHDDSDVAAAFESAAREAQAYFGSGVVYLERYLEDPKHLEVQILAPDAGTALWLGVRDCSLQRRHQKLIEETPPSLAPDRVAEMGEAAVALSKACGYVNAGTVEMLLQDDRFYFLEVNARLQVEHTVTEEVLGLDLVACQLKIAAGDALDFTQVDVAPRGHAIECRINAEDPGRSFLPTPGLITAYSEPAGLGVRVDSGYGAGDEVPRAYDSLLGKLVVWAPDRESARRRMLRALDDWVIEGITTTIPAHRLLLQDPSFVEGSHTTRTVEDTDVLASLVEAATVAGDEVAGDFLLVDGHPVSLWHATMSPSATGAVHGIGGTGDVVAPMQGTILKVVASVGQRVAAGDELLVVEAMKMETTVAAPMAGVVTEIRVAEGATAFAGEVLAVIEP